MKSRIYSKFVSLIFVLVLLLCSATILSCGSNTETLEYKINSDGAPCTITGIGNYSSDNLIIPYNIGNYRVTAIADYAFQGTNIITFSATDALTKIGKGAFYNCKQLKTVTIPSEIVEISESCFSNCENLNIVNLPTNLKIIGKSAFARCFDIVNIYIPDSVVEIGPYAFESCESLLSIEIPSEIQIVEPATFLNCFSLGSVLLPSELLEIGNMAFEGCETLVSVNIPNTVAKIGDYAFAGCLLLPEIVIPDSVTQIGNNAFSACINLKDIYIPSSVELIGVAPFHYTNLDSIDVDINNTNLSSVDGNLYFVDETIFVNYACGKTNPSFEIPNGVTKIWSMAFSGCFNLNTIYIPQSVDYIGNYIFYASPNIETVYYDGTVAEWKKIQKELEWKDTESDFSIICTDGTIAMDGTVTYN